MSWPVDNWAGADWSAAAAIGSLWRAVNERAQALSPLEGTLLTPAAGDDVQYGGGLAPGAPGVGRSFSLRVLQQRVEDLCPHYVWSHDGGAERSSGHFDGTAGTFPRYGGLGDLFQAAGLPWPSWRAYTVHPAEGGTPEYRPLRAGDAAGGPSDLVGPWLFEDLQAALNVMAWTEVRMQEQRPGGPLADWHSADNNAADTCSTTNYHLEWDGARMEVNTMEPANLHADSLPPRMFTHGYLRDNARYEAQKFASRHEGRIRNLWAGDGAGRRIDWYVLTGPLPFTGSDMVYDPQGQHALAYRWTCWNGDDAALPSTTVTSSTPFGDRDSVPQWCANPTVNPIPPGGRHTFAGFDVPLDGLRAIVRWRFRYGP